MGHNAHDAIVVRGARQNNLRNLDLDLPHNALIVVTGTLTVYLYRQASAAGKQIAEAKTVIAHYNQAEPNIVNFINELVVFGQKNPEFTQQVLKKYGVSPQPIAPKR